MLAKKNAENKHVTDNDINRIILNKANVQLRIEQIKQSGFAKTIIKQDGEVEIKPTASIRYMAFIMHTIGLITNTLKQYEDVKNEK